MWRWRCIWCTLDAHGEQTTFFLYNLPPKIISIIIAPFAIDSVKSTQETVSAMKDAAKQLKVESAKIDLSAVEDTQDDMEELLFDMAGAEEKQRQYRAEVYQKTKRRLEAWAAIEEEKERKIEEEARLREERGGASAVWEGQLRLPAQPLRQTMPLERGNVLRGPGPAGIDVPVLAGAPRGRGPPGSALGQQRP